ncbi:MAG TPA: putative inorganic carbon transporter subunit DabA [Bryobacteraceae bacterium]|nr:putative inorganic carbon transporter subunit DabA [Bryobacteraceae bacterium]
MRRKSHSVLSGRDTLLQAVEHAAHLLPMQGPIGVFIHHNTLHAFEHLPFEQAVIEASRLFGAEPYMTEAAYRTELARGRIQIEDINFVLGSEPDAVVFPGLMRRALRRAMITPGVREFDAATILWRTEQGDLARDFRHAALRTLFQACFDRTVVHEEEPVPPRPIDEIIHPWLIRLCSVFLDQGTAYWPMPYRERGFYESVRELLSRRGGMFPKYLSGLDEEFRRQKNGAFSATDAVLDYLEAHNPNESEWKGIIQSELLALPGWAGLMRRLEEKPGLAPHEPVPCSLMDFLAVRLTMSRVAARMGAAESGPRENPLKTEERRRLSRTARIYDRITAWTFAGCMFTLAALIHTLGSTGASAVVVTFGNWFAVHEYRFPLVLMADRLSLPFLVMTVVLSGLIGQFSATYLHRERGFFRFFVLLDLFAFGSLLAFAAGSFDLLIAGWELVGISSVLLIAFHDHRPAAGKAAQIPFSGWLPRAMEGPTPSSAIFYGGISIHAGAYLLLRVQPLLAHMRVAAVCVIVVGLATAIYGTIVGRASAAAKTSLAFASLTQVGVVFAEIGIGWRSIAIAHILGHAVVRTLQFLRSPSKEPSLSMRSPAGQGIE